MPHDPRQKSRAITEGADRAPARAMLKAIGFTSADLRRPIVGVANPYGAISSAAMLLRHSLGLEREARAVEAAVSSAIDFGALTGDIAPHGTRPVTTKEAGDAVLAALQEARA